MSGSNGEKKNEGMLSAGQVSIATSDEIILNPIYVNLMMINPTKADVVLDFAHFAPLLPAAHHKVRIVTSLHHYKRMVTVMNGVLAKIEAEIGEIKLPESPGEVVFPAGN